METFFGRFKNILVLVLVLLVQVIGLAVQVRRPSSTIQGAQDGREVRLLRYWVVAIVTPPEKALHFIGGGFRSIWSSYIDLRHTKDENRALKEQIDRLRFEQASLLEDARQGQRLQTLLNFRQSYVYKTVPAQVIGTSGTDQSRVLYIDKGSADGLKTDQPVITPDGIVGKIRDVFPHTAQVLVINDQSSGAGVILETTRIRGILRGNSAGQPQIINILPDERIKPGERVVTSGGDQVFPRGLPVGIVDHIIRDPDRDPYVDVLIRPGANLARLEEVLVITGIGDKMPPDQLKDIQLSEELKGADVVAEKEKKKAAELLAERLPGLKDPNAPAPTDQQQTPEGANPGIPNTSTPAHPAQILHPDRFSPSSVPPANELTPGKSVPRSTTPGSAPAPSTTRTVPSAAGATGSTGSAERPLTTPRKTIIPQPGAAPTAPKTGAPGSTAPKKVPAPVRQTPPNAEQTPPGGDR